MSLLSRFGRKPSPRRVDYEIDASYLYNLPIEKDGRSDYSITSSTGSSHGSPPSEDNTQDIDGVSFASSFRPEDCSSSPPLRFTKSNQIPELRDSAKKYRPHKYADNNFSQKINIAAINDFQDFSQGSIDSSQELPRGNKPFTRLPTIEEPYSASLVSSSPFINTPVSPSNAQISQQVADGVVQTLSPEGAQRVMRQSSPKDTQKRRVSQKENIPPYSPSPYVSHASRSTSGQRKPFTDLHARVQDDSEKSFMGDERPITTTISPKLSRFNNPNTVQRTDNTQDQHADFDVSRTTKASVTKTGDKGHQARNTDSSQKPITKIGDNGHQARKTSISSDTRNITEQRTSSPTAPTTKSFFIEKAADTSMTTKSVQMPIGIRGGKVHTQSHPSARHGIKKADDMAVTRDEENILQSLADAQAENKRLTMVNHTQARRIKTLESTIARLESENEAIRTSQQQEFQNMQTQFQEIHATNDRMKTDFEAALAMHTQHVQAPTPVQLSETARDLHRAQQAYHTQATENLLHPPIQIAEDDITQNSQLTRISHTDQNQHHHQNARETQPETARPTLSSAARQVLDSLCPHDQQNCGLCINIISAKSVPHLTVTIPRRTPVSLRKPIKTQHEDDDTLRPSQSPRLAVEKVIKDIEEEIEHLKLDCAQLQSAYYNLDVSVGKRQRKGMKSGIQQRMETIERKSDQLYDLYDVLEGF